MSHFDHGFGVEIECYLPEGQTRQALSVAINQRLGENVCEVESYNHHARPTWKIVIDGSLGDYSRGIEIVSPVLKGEADLAKVETVCRALVDFGCSVSKKCGLHVHVGVGNASLKFWKDIVSIYSVYEPVIDQMMPASRRASNNVYCRTMTSVSLDRIQAALSFDQINTMTSSGAGDSRYRKVNMSAYMRHRTVEFRQHSGTSDANKVKNWVIICLKMVDLAKKEQFNVASFTQTSINQARRGTKNYLVGELILRPEGVTPAEACAATGWDSISIPAHASICGITVTAQKTGRLTRYFANRAATVSVNADSFATVLDLSASERSYVNQRINDLSGQVAWAA